MYTTYFGLREKPFNVTPDPRFFYANPVYREAYASLVAGVQERKGFIVMTGEVGTGKTTLLRMLMANLEATVRFAYLYNTTLSFEELLAYTCDELGIAVEGDGRLKRIQALNAFLIDQLRRGGTGVLLIDEAQNLGADVLENLRLLSNLETSTEKLLQIVLVGQPELEAKLAEPGLRQLRQRVSVQSRLDRLKDREVEPYIRFRLETAGARRTDLFDGQAVDRVAFYSTGIPRLINIICDNALTIAYATSVKRVSGGIVEEVSSDLGLQARPVRPAVLPGVTRAEVTAPAPVPAEPRSASEIMRRRALRRPRRRWPGWARVGAVVAALALAAGVAALSAPSFTGPIAATGASLRETWNSLAERMTLARLRGASSSAPTVAPSGTVATVAGGTPAPPLSPVRPSAGSETPPGTAEPTLPPRGDATAGRGDGGDRARPIVIPNGSTIAEIAFKSYGRYNLLAIDLIKEFNPHIVDLNWIRAGEQLRLPSLDAETLIRRQPDGSYRVILGSFLSRRAAERIRDGVRRAGYDVDLLTRRLTDTLEVHRVEMTGLPTRDVAQQAWNTALAKCWLQIADTPCERTNHG